MKCFIAIVGVYAIWFVKKWRGDEFPIYTENFIYSVFTQYTVRVIFLQPVLYTPTITISFVRTDFAWDSFHFFGGGYKALIRATKCFFGRV